MDYNEKIRTYLRELISNGALSPESEYNQKGLYLKYPDGDISATTDTGKKAFDFFKLRMRLIA
jgi:hypothetical protein